MNNISKLILCTFLFSLQLSIARAEEVTLKFNDLTLNANLELAEGKKLSDGVVLIMHSFLAHNGMEIIKAGQDALLENEQSSLAINLSYGVDNRHGSYDCMTPISFKLSDAMTELDAWLNWLKSQGVKKSVLMGHSISANQVLIYAVDRNDPVIACLEHLLLVPNTVGHPSSPERYETRYGASLEKILERAKKMIAEGKADQLMENTDFGFCPKSSVTADAFYDFYQQGNKFWTAHLYLTDVKVPTLVIAASMDEVQPDIEKHVKPYVDNKLISLTVIDGAGHFFRDFNIEDAVEKAVEFIAKLDSSSQ